MSAVVLEDRIVATLVDLSAYRQLEERVRRSEERFRLIAEHSRDNIWTMNLAGEFTYISPSLESMLGYTPEEYQSLPLGSTFSPESQARVQEALDAARARVAAGLPVAFEAELKQRGKDGSFHWSHEIAVAMYDRDGKFIEFMGISRDITLRRQQEAALRQARDAAEVANAAKSRFLATITHELRTPLHAILGFTQVLAGLQEAPGSAKLPNAKEAQRRRDLLAGIERNGRHLLALVNDLLDLSRLESGHLALRARPTGLRRLLENCLADFATLAAERGLGLYLKFHPKLPARLLIDRLRLRQILANLLGNALTYTSRGEVTLMAEAAPSATGPGAVALSLSVTDTGPGIAPADHDRLFSLFGRGEDGLKAGKFKGTGLGLVICRQLATLMGGEIRLDSVPGQGSRFTLWLPAVPLAIAGKGQGQAGKTKGGVRLPGVGAEDELSTTVRAETIPVPSPSSPSAAPALSTPSSPTPSLAPSTSPVPPPSTALGPSLPRTRGPDRVPLTLLVIDDEPDNLHLAAEILRDQGLELVSAPDGATGLRLAATLRPDLILLDIRMPGLDGFQVCERLKTDPATRSIPVIFLSALDHYEDKARGFAAGGVDYVTKPCDARELLLRVTNHLRLAQAAPGPAAVSPGEPSVAEATLAPDRSLVILLRARDRFVADLANPPDLNALARDCGTNRTTLQHLFQAKLGMSVFGYLREQRLQRALRLLAAGGYGIDEVATRVGYRHGHNFTRAFKQRFGLTPSQLLHLGIQTPSDYGLIQMSSAPIDTTAETAAEREVQALDPVLEERIKARTAKLEAEISARRRLEDELRARNAHLEPQLADCATGFRAAYSALRESESRFRAIFNHVSDGILIQDPETGQVIAINDRLVEQFGGRHEEVLAMGFGALPVAGVLVIGLLLGLISTFSYLLLHTLVELFSIGVAFAILLLVWNTREGQGIGLLRIIALGFGGAAVIDLAHVLAYKGMSVFPRR